MALGSLVPAAEGFFLAVFLVLAIFALAGFPEIKKVQLSLG